MGSITQGGMAFGQGLREIGAARGRAKEQQKAKDQQRKDINSRYKALVSVVDGIEGVIGEDPMAQAAFDPIRTLLQQGEDSTLEDRAKIIELATPFLGQVFGQGVEGQGRQAEAKAAAERKKQETLIDTLSGQVSDTMLKTGVTASEAVNSMGLPPEIAPEVTRRARDNASDSLDVMAKRQNVATGGLTFDDIEVKEKDGIRFVYSKKDGTLLERYNANQTALDREVDLYAELFKKQGNSDEDSRQMALDAVLSPPESELTTQQVASALGKKLDVGDKKRTMKEVIDVLNSRGADKLVRKDNTVRVRQGFGGIKGFRLRESDLALLTREPYASLLDDEVKSFLVEAQLGDNPADSEELAPGVREVRTP